MGTHKNQGFTIVEISFVLAISSLLFALMATGVTLAVQRQRFSDSVNGAQSYLQQQFNFTQNTINNRTVTSCDPSNPGNPLPTDLSVRGASNCLVIGKLLEIPPAAGDEENIISSYDVIGANVDTEATTPINYKDMPDLELIRTIKPTVIKQTTLDSSYGVPWGAQLSNIQDANATGSSSSAVRFLALLRSPRSGIIHIYKINNDISAFADSPDATRQLSSGPLDTNIQEITNDSVKMCISSVDLATLKAMLEIIPSGSQDGVVSHFDDGAKEDYPC